MRIGPYRQRVTLETLTVAYDAYNQQVQTWTPLMTLSAMIRNTGGREVTNARQIKAELTHKVHTRYLGQMLKPGEYLTPQWRLIYDGRALNITTVVDVDERHRELIIDCQEVLETPP
jgi:SPP1 family predicted phage head-tail adaptor